MGLGMSAAKLTGKAGSAAGRGIKKGGIRLGQGLKTGGGKTADWFNQTRTGRKLNVFKNRTWPNSQLGQDLAFQKQRASNFFKNTLPNSKVVQGAKTLGSATKGVYDDVNPFREVGHAFATDGTVLQGVQQTFKKWEDVMKEMKDASADKVQMALTKTGATIGKVPIVGGVVSGAGMNQQLVDRLQIEFDRKIQEGLRTSLKDLLEVGDVSQKLDKIEQLMEKGIRGDREAKIATEMLYEQLTQKQAGFMDGDQSRRYMQIAEKILDSENPNKKDKGAVRTLFTQALTDRTGYARTKNAFLGALKLGRGGVTEGWHTDPVDERLYKEENAKPAVDLSKMNLELMKGTSGLELMQELAKPDGKYTVRPGKKVAASVAKIFYDDDKAAEAGIPDDNRQMFQRLFDQTGNPI